MVCESCDAQDKLNNAISVPFGTVVISYNHRLYLGIARL